MFIVYILWYCVAAITHTYRFYCLYVLMKCKQYLDKKLKNRVARKLYLQAKAKKKRITMSKKNVFDIKKIKFD